MKVSSTLSNVSTHAIHPILMDRIKHTWFPKRQFRKRENGSAFILCDYVRCVKVRLLRNRQRVPDKTTWRPHGVGKGGFFSLQSFQLPKVTVHLQFVDFSICTCDYGLIDSTKHLLNHLNMAFFTLIGVIFGHNRLSS